MVVFPNSIINFRIQHLTRSPIYYHVTIYDDIFLKFVPSEFFYHIIYQALIIHFFIDE